MGRYSLPSVPKRMPLGQLVYEALLEAIVSGKLELGSKLVEDEIAREMNVSTTPVREALLRLEQDGLIERRPYRGAVVVGWDRTTVAETYQVRIALERLAISLAAQRVTDEQIEKLRRLHQRAEERVAQSDLKGYLELDERFHRFILEIAGNKTLVSIMNGLRHKTNALMATTIRFPGMPQKSAGHHRKMVEALARRDAVEAERMMIVHLEDSLSEILQVLDAQGTKQSTA